MVLEIVQNLVITKDPVLMEFVFVRMDGPALTVVFDSAHQIAVIKVFVKMLSAVVTMGLLDSIVLNWLVQTNVSIMDSVKMDVASVNLDGKDLIAV